jgi:aminoglycoside 2''-phosphotransferase
MFLSELTLSQIRQGLEQTFPGPVPDLNRLKVLNDGFSSYVILLADEFILRIAKHAEAMAGHVKEWTILPLLQRYLPVEIPQPAWRAEPSDFFPFGAIGYRRIFGVPFSLNLVPQAKLEPIAQDIARFLTALHNVPLAEMTALSFRQPHELESLWAEVLPILHANLTEEEFEKIRTWRERSRNHRGRDSYSPRLIHGDPWGENIILNETLDGVTGVIDFESMSIGDAAQDFAAQKYLGQDFSNQVIEHYQKSGGTLERHFALRLQSWSMLRELTGLQYAIRYPASGELLDSLQKVRNELDLSL